MNSKKTIPKLSKRIFWDVNLTSMDIDAKYAFVIERVFERGDVEDIRQCRRYFGDQVVKQVLLNAKFLPEHRLYLASAIIDEPINAFKCYTLRQSNPKLYPY